MNLIPIWQMRFVASHGGLVLGSERLTPEIALLAGRRTPR